MRLLVYNRTAVHRMVFINEAGYRIMVWIGRTCFFNRLGKFNFKAIGHRTHRLHFKGHFPGPHNPLQPKPIRSGRAPAAVGLSDKQRAILAPAHAQYPRLKSFAETKGSTLVNAVYFFQENPRNFTLSLIANENLAGKWPETAFAIVGNYF